MRRLIARRLRRLASRLDPISFGSSDWSSSPNDQVRQGIEYIRARYGSPGGDFWKASGWYTS